MKDFLRRKTLFGNGNKKFKQSLSPKYKISRPKFQERLLSGSSIGIIPGKGFHKKIIPKYITASLTDG
jgi:hypothetical protein